MGLQDLLSCLFHKHDKGVPPYRQFDKFLSFQPFVESQANFLLFNRLLKVSNILTFFHRHVNFKICQYPIKFNDFRRQFAQIP